jgi:dissimilatory sulfite reductase alpha subunit
VTVLIGGKRTLKIGDTDGHGDRALHEAGHRRGLRANLVELAATVIDFWAENGLEHERCGEMIERIGLATSSRASASRWIRT